MKFRTILMSAMIATLLLLPSCLTVLQIEISCDQFNKNPNAVSEFQATVGETIMVKLCSNPATGFQWKYEIIGQDVLEETDHKFVPAEGEGVVEASGQEIWTFHAVEKGTAEVRMEYSRPWEGGEQKEWTFIFTATVE